MSTILYLIYTNEVPLLHNLMKDKEWTVRNVGKEPESYDAIQHETISFIDDSNSIIMFDNPEDAQRYIEDFFQLLQIYYSDMRLALNTDKTTLMVVSRPNLSRYKHMIKLEDVKETIRPKAQIKMLGWLQNERMDQSTNLSASISAVNMILTKLKPIEEHLNEKT